MHEVFYLALRTAAHIVEEYNAARTAKLKILEAQQGSMADKSILRARLSEVNDELRRLDKEYSKITGTGGIAINTGILRRDP